jgi:hypothetical protein
MPGADAFEMCFRLQEASWRVEEDTPEQELVRFAERQIRTLLSFVTLYQDGRVVAPDAFAVVNRPERVVPLSLDAERSEEGEP